MIIAISGTPGVGKSSIAKILGEKLNYKVIDIGKFVKDTEIYDGYDYKRNTYIVNPEVLNKKLEKIAKKNCVLDGHLSHFYPNSDFVFVLRLRPDELRSRLEKRGYTHNKILENVQAEILDVILQEAVSLHKRVYEIDATGKKPQNLAEMLIEVIKIGSEDDNIIIDKAEEMAEKYKPGKVNWMYYSTVK